MRGTLPLVDGVDRDEALRRGMPGALNVPLWLASVFFGGYVAFRQRLWNGAVLIVGVQLWLLPTALHHDT